MSAITEPNVSAEEYRAFRERGGVVDLASRVKLCVSGADRLRYINGQVTANIAASKESSVVPACVTSPKGKMCADVFVGVWPGWISIDADSKVRETLQARLERYIVADDVKIEDHTERASLVHCIAHNSKHLDNVLSHVPWAGTWPLARFGIQGTDFFPRWRTQLDELWNHLAAHFPILSDALLELIRIEHGIPRWGRELDEATLPHEAGLDRTHIDFHKGCYIGQEVISRLRSVGHVNREMRGFVSADGVPLTAGARIFSVAEPARDLGRLTSAAFSFALDRHIALGYLRRDAAGGEFLAATPEATDAPVRIAVHPLPFIP